MKIFIEWLVLYTGPTAETVCGTWLMLGQSVLYTNSAFKNFYGPTALAIKVFTGSLRPAGNEARPQDFLGSRNMPGAGTLGRWLGV